MDNNEKYRIITTVGPAKAAMFGVYDGSGSGAVASVNGKTGVVVLDPTDVGAATSAQGDKADTAVQPAGLTKSAVGLSNVDNTSDANKPVSTATQTALNLKAPLANPAFTGTVTGITATMVGLGNVNNTSDVNKPVSTAQQTALNLKLNTASTFTNTLTSGTNASITQDVAVTPTANTTQVPIGHRVQLNYNSGFNVTTGGYMLGFESVLNTQGTGTHDKMVGNLSQLNLTGGNVTSALGFEAEIASIAAGTLVGGFAGFYFPNLAGVANIGNVSQMAALQNDHSEAVIRSAGPFQTQKLVEVAPPYSIGLVANRYYSAPYDTIAAAAISTNVIYLVPVYVPQRTTVTKLGFQVTTAATTGGLARLGIYRAQNGQPTELIIDAGTVATTSLGAKEITINTRLDSGTYFIAANFNIACSINFHSGNAVQRAAMYGQSSPTTTGGGLENATYIASGFAAFPSQGVTPVFAVTQAEPHLWFRP